MLKNEIKALKSLELYTGRKTLPVKAVSQLGSSIQYKGEKRQTSEARSLKGSQMQHEIELPMRKASTPNQLKQTQSGDL